MCVDVQPAPACLGFKTEVRFGKASQSAFISRVQAQATTVRPRFGLFRTGRPCDCVWQIHLFIGCDYCLESALEWLSE